MIWICGARGLLGRHIEKVCEDRGLAFISTGREIDITSMKALEDFHGEHSTGNSPAGKIDTVINCAAWTDVPGAAANHEACARLNVTGPGNLASLCRRKGMRLVHFSTDHVFTRAAVPGKALVETDPLEPANAYGQSKRLGEEAVRASGCDYLILRTSWLYGQGGRNLVDIFVQSMMEGRKLLLVTDQVSVPTWCGDLAAWTLDLLAHDPADKTSRLLHCVPRGHASPRDLALEIKAILEDLSWRIPVDCLQPVSARDYPGQVSRPAWSVLDPHCLEEILARPQPDWKSGLRRHIGTVYGSPVQGGKSA